MKIVFDKCVFSKHILFRERICKELRDGRVYPELQRSCAIRLCYRTNFHVGRDLIYKGDGSGVKNVSLLGIIFPPWPFCKKRTINAVVDYASPLSPMAVTLICQYTSSLDSCQN